MSSNNTNISPHRDHNNQVKRVPKTVPWAWFILIYLRSIAKQVIPIYINHSRQLFPDEISLFFNTVWEEREARPILICWALSKEASVTIFLMFLVRRSQGSNPWPPPHGENALTTEPPLRYHEPAITCLSSSIKQTWVTGSLFLISTFCRWWTCNTGFYLHMYTLSQMFNGITTTRFSDHLKWSLVQKKARNYVSP